jgi:hypothetical protein
MSWGNTRIVMRSGEKHDCTEYPARVREIRDRALADRSLMELERPVIPTGQKMYLDPTQVESIKGIE